MQTKPSVSHQLSPNYSHNVEAEYLVDYSSLTICVPTELNSIGFDYLVVKLKWDFTYDEVLEQIFFNHGNVYDHYY